MLALSDLRVGQEARFRWKLTPELLKSFGKLVGDTSPIHTNEAFARRHGFREPIACGFFTGALFSRLYGHFLPGGGSICLHQEMTFNYPVYPGDEVTVHGRITAIQESTGVVTLETQVLVGEKVCVSGKGRVLMLVKKAGAAHEV